VTTDAVKLAPSILTADFAHLGDQVAEAERRLGLTFEFRKPSVPEQIAFMWT
jgi:hypothetical protein